MWSSSFGPTTDETHKRFREATGLPADDGNAEKRPRKQREPREGDLESEIPVDRWRHDWTQSKWNGWLNDPRSYIEESYQGKRFRRKFAVPRAVFDALLAKTLAQPLLGDGGEHLRGPRRVPARLKLLATLRLLKTGMTYEALEDSACLDELTIRKYFLAWTAWYCEHEYPKVVQLPDDDELCAAESIYAQCGFPGAWCSIDGVKFGPWAGAPSRELPSYVSGKDKCATLGFLAAVNHNRKFYYVSGAHPGARNDINLCNMDPVLVKAKADALYADKTFSVKLQDGTHSIKGMWTINDCGMPRWRCMQQPLKWDVRPNVARWSKRFESVRKDVECAFGILKKRFGWLSGTIRVRDQAVIENVVKVCMLLPLPC